ncbi:MAG: hypothetical protein CM15mP74_04650 [Halieaceae bacterium]|nr:MAG: hypothetical protein CM15mP74_04650 [Halieaceae bacterium]
MRKFLSLKLPIVLAGLLFANTAAWGHSKTDLITVSTGDTLTGAINNMVAGKLSLSTDYAGTISIKWREIEQIQSRYLYEVRLDEGGQTLRPFCRRGYRPINSLFEQTSDSSWGQKFCQVMSSAWPCKFRGLCASPRRRL